MSTNVQRWGWVLVLGCALLLVLPAASSTTSMSTFFNQGTMDHTYTGSATGGFSADGSVSTPSEFPVDAAGAAMGYYTTSDEPGMEFSMFLGYGGVVNPDQTMDIVFLWIVREGETSLATGQYLVDSEETVVAIFFDDADDLLIYQGAPPVVISAAHVCLAEVGGSITLDAIDHTGLTGSFSCTFIDEVNPSWTVTATNCPFTLSQSGTPVEAMSWGEVKARY